MEFGKSRKQPNKVIFIGKQWIRASYNEKDYLDWKSCADESLKEEKFQKQEKVLNEERVFSNEAREARRVIAKTLHIKGL
jgi:hypothetical protein